MSMFEDVANEETPVAAVRRQAALGEFVTIMQRSWDNDVAIGVTIAEDQKGKVSNRFRAAAAELQMGLSMAYIEAPGTESHPVPEGKVRIIVQAKEKRAYTPQNANGGEKKKARITRTRKAK